MNYVIYRYVDVRDQTILYVGKTKRALSERVAEHAAEMKFAPYLPYSQVQYYVVHSHVLMDIHEKYWIHMYQPMLNVVDKFVEEAHLPLGFSFDHVYWQNDSSDGVSDNGAAVASKSNEKAERLLALLEALEQEDVLYANAEAFLEYSFEQYAFDSHEECNSMLGFHWDLDRNPLPDFLKIWTETLSFYIRAEFVSEIQGYLLWNEFTVMRRLWSKASDAIRELRADLTKQRLLLEEQLE